MEAKRVAVIVGEGLLPVLQIEQMQRQGLRVLALGIKGISPKETVEKAQDHVWLELTQIGKAIKACLKRQITGFVMGGRVRHQVIFGFSLLKMDWTTLKLWFSLKDKRADTILLKIVEAFENKGVICLDQTQHLKDQLICDSGCIVGPCCDTLLKQAEFGFSIAKGIGALDIGQSVVIKDFAVVAVEAMEGTNKCLNRAYDIAKEGCILIKVAKPKQDLRFDVPTIGMQTIEHLIKIKAKALVVEVEKTLFLDKSQCLQALEKAGIALVSMKAPA